MRRTLIIALALLVVPLAGCATEDGGQDTPDTVEVVWTQEPQGMDAGQAMDVAWELTGPDREIQHTGLHWAASSVEDPEGPGDYGNSSGVQQPADVPGAYETTVTIEEPGTYHFRAHAIVDDEHVWTDEVSVEIEASGPAEPPVVVTIDGHTSSAAVDQRLWVNWSLTGTPDEVNHTGFHWAAFSVEDPKSPGDYANSSGVLQPADVPGSYSANFTEEEAGTYHGRAHVIHGGQHYWSDEVTFEVTGGGGGGGGGGVTHHTVDMATFSYDPMELTVSPGDTINWTNSDPSVHTVTFEDAENGTRSGDIESGSFHNWTVPASTPAGEYRYRCTYHSTGFSTGMVATITVE